MLGLTAGTNTRWEIRMFILVLLTILDFSKVIYHNCLLNPLVQFCRSVHVEICTAHPALVGPALLHLHKMPPKNVLHLCKSSDTTFWEPVQVKQATNKPGSWCLSGLRILLTVALPLLQGTQKCVSQCLRVLPHTSRSVMGCCQLLCLPLGLLSCKM